MARVLRLRAGQQVIVLDGLGSEMEVELMEVSSKCSQGIVRERREALGEPRSQVHLYLGLTQREKFEWILQKCTEVGVTGFTPVITSRSLVQDAKETDKKLERWERIVQEAAEQSGRGKVPLLHPVIRLENIKKEMDNGRGEGSAARLVLWEGEHQKSLSEHLKTVKEESGKLRIDILVGPEGGLSEAEVKGTMEAGFEPVSLGKRILRMETAAVVAAALVLYDLGEMGV